MWQRKWHPAEDALLLSLYDAGEDWRSISERIGRPGETCKSRCYHLTASKRLREQERFFREQVSARHAREDARRAPFVEPPRERRTSTADPYAALYARALSEAGL